MTEKQIFYAKNYISRPDLEAHIMSKIGSDTEKNKEAGHLIKGTKTELKNLSLSDRTSIWGVKCETIYGSTEKDLQKKLTDKGGKWKE